MTSTAATSTWTSRIAGLAYGTAFTVVASFLSLLADTGSGVLLETETLFQITPEVGGSTVTFTVTVCVAAGVNLPSVHFTTDGLVGTQVGPPGFADTKATPPGNWSCSVMSPEV